MDPEMVNLSNPDTICRLCMIKVDKDAVKLFKRPADHVRTIQLYFKIQISKIMEISQMICKDCSLKVTMISKFRKEILDSERRWMQYKRKRGALYGTTKCEESEENSEEYSEDETNPVAMDVKPIKEIQCEEIIVLKDDDPDTEMEDADKEKVQPNLEDSEFEEKFNPTEIFLTPGMESSTDVPQDDNEEWINEIIEEETPSPLNTTDEPDETELSSMDNSESEKETVPMKEPKRNETELNPMEISENEKDTAPTKEPKRKPKFYKKRSRMCHICGRICSERRFESHLKSHVSVECQKCGETIADKWKLLIHNKEFHSQAVERQKNPPIKVACHICGKLFPENGPMKAHIEITHSDAPSEECPICHKYFFSVEAHMNKIHNPNRKKLSCPQCGKKLWSLKVHLKTNCSAIPNKVIVKPFKCDKCDKAYTGQQDLKDHINFKHFGITVPCQFCSYGGSDRRTTIKHMTTKHTKEYQKWRKSEDEKKLAPKERKKVSNLLS